MASLVHLIKRNRTMGHQVRENDPAPLIFHRQTQPGEG